MHTFDATTPLYRLLARCELGMTIVITRSGHPVARLIPYAPRRDPMSTARAVKRLRAFGRGIKLPKGMTIEDLIDEGRP